MKPHPILAWLRRFWPAPIVVDGRERLRAAAGGVLGILITAVLCQRAHAGLAGPWLVAPLGASAVLVFAVPASPLAQPWSVVGGNTLSALVGILAVRLVGTPELAAALAVGGAIAVMFALRCLHPPGGASALLVALTGVAQPGFAIFPVMTNSVLLVAAGIAYNQATRRAYPHMQVAEPDPEPDPLDADLDAVLARYNQVLDVSRDDLKTLLADTRWRAYERTLATTRCGDVMSRRLITVTPATPLADAWALFRTHHIKSLPVVDGDGRAIGILAPSDFLLAADLAGGGRLDEALRTLRDWTRGRFGAPTVAALMTRTPRVTRDDVHLADLLPLFGSSGHHHLPVVDDDDRLVGMITESDVVAALCRADDASAVTARAPTT